MDYTRLSVSDFITQAGSGSLNLRDFYPRLFKRLRELDRTYNIFVTLPEEQVISLAKLTRKPSGLLAGLPVSLKDNICSEGIQATAGSRILRGYEPPFDSTVASRIKSRGGVIIGKTQMDEFGFGWASTNSGWKIPRNPHDPARVTGGSSGGAAALVASLDYPHMALGQSTGGSISSPASFCGVVGLTPTYGLVSRYGLIDFGNSLDKIGPITRTARDAALMLSVIAGHDPRDPTTARKPAPDYRKRLKPSVKGLRIGVPREYFEEGVDPKVSETVWSAIRGLESLGARYREISLPMTPDAIAIYYIIAASEASTNLAKFCGIRYGAEEPIEGDFNEYFSRVRSRYLGEEAKRRIILGTYCRMAGYRDQYYLKAMQARTLLIREFRGAFRTCDALATPSMPCIAPKLKEIPSMSPLQNYMMDILTVAPNLAGIPTISLPCGRVRGMPVGLQLMANHLGEQALLNAAHAYEKEEKK
jgi:aspartyl-tRNA(Asn)/glutamyl-tRNA(Gln) amidotransferase subunit A